MKVRKLKKFESSRKKVRKFKKVKILTSTQIPICNPGHHHAHSGHDAHSDVHESILSDTMHRYRHIVYETAVLTQIWCTIHLLDGTAAFLSARYHFSEAFKEMAQALLSSVVFFGFLGVII